MKLSNALQCFTSLLMLVLEAAQVSAVIQFSSHITVNTPARSYSHGVGNPISHGSQETPHFRPTDRRNMRQRIPIHREGTRGYPRVKPSVPFDSEDSRSVGFRTTPYLHNNFKEVNIPLLPPSPYKVNSPDPESLWPEGLFLPPVRPVKFGSTFDRRVDSAEDSIDPYLLEGSEAIAAVQRAKSHGLYYFQDIPHIESLLAHQELRARNQLEPLRIASIRHTWPYNRP